MKAWDEIINKALLGSEKAPLTAADLPLEITNAYDVQESPDKEDTFLKISAMANQYRQGGARPFKVTDTLLPIAHPESKEYCSKQANEMLKVVLDEDIAGLLLFWLRLCSSSNQLAHPEIIPSLLNAAQRKKEIRTIIHNVAGERGKWLCDLNPEWNFTQAQTDAARTWSEGTAEERKELLTSLRKTDPDAGRKYLESSWATEGANEKTAFLEIMKVNASDGDLVWVESLKEKAKKVNDAILALLKLIPSSAVIREYEGVLSNCVQLKTGKALLGMISKTEVVIDETYAFPESIFKTGIEKMSSNKDISDGQNIIAQLTMQVPPSFWNRHLQRTTEEIIELMQKSKQAAFYLPAIAIASVHFNDQTWTKVILEKADKDLFDRSIVALIEGLSDDERTKYALKFIERHPAEIVQLMLSNEKEWSLDLTKAILRYTAREVYQYNKQFYKQAVALIPASILNHLDSFTPSEDQRKPYWQTQRDELARLLMIKQQTLQSFNA